MHVRSRGFTIIEVVIASTLMTVIVLAATTLLRNQLDIVSHVANHDYTFQPAQSALWKVRDELLSVVQSPAGVTNAVAPVYAVSAPDAPGSLPGAPVTTPFSSITWRPLVGIPSTNDPTFSDFYLNGASWGGCLSSNGVLYSKTAKTLWVNTINDPKYGNVNVLQLDTVDNTHTTANPLVSQVLLGNPKIGENVTAFRLFNAESTAKFTWASTGTAGVNWAAGATATTYLLGVYVRVEHKSVLPTNFNTSVAGGGINTTSNYDNSQTEATDLRMAILVAPETLTNSTGKPFVGP